MGRPAKLPGFNTGRARNELTALEKDIAEFVHNALTNSQIAELIGRSEEGIKSHLRRIFDKTGMCNRVELALWYEVHHCDGKCLQCGN
jgi:DNA-binding NarL/FixJ family response regulator